MKTAFDEPRGKILLHRPLNAPERYLRFEGPVGSEILRFSTQDGEDPYMVPSAAGPIMTTVFWAYRETAAGRLVDTGLLNFPSERGKRFVGWDEAACEARDPKSTWRRTWGLLAIQAGIRRSESPLKAWLKTAEGPEPKPHWRSLIRYMNQNGAGSEAGGVGDVPASAFVNKSGRLPGQSQLSDVEDRLLHMWATRFWQTPRIASKDDAAAFMTVDWHTLKAKGVAGLANRPPTAQAMSDRIDSLRCRATVASRFGHAEATRLYGAVGEPVPVEDCLELVMIDGVQFRHAVPMDPEWHLEVPQMKAIFAMDAKSQYVWKPPVFFGPFRPEMATRALMNVMVCDLTEEEIAADPRRVGLYQPPKHLYFDNDRALLPPGVVPNLVSVVGSLETGAPYSPDEKGKLENFFKYLKHNLNGLPGQILGPRRRSDPRRDPISEATVDRLQYAAHVRSLSERWNRQPKKSLGNRSPEQIMLAEVS